tara:strand:- start:2535 stop:4340 length:1806 start_codon:yes stop_codon:yes gene_type:complete
MVKKFTPPIKYTDRDFQSIKQSLFDYAKKYYPNTAADFNEASFGALMLDMVSYVGDVLSFYVDYQASESFMDSAVEFKNVLRLAQQMGFKYSPDVSAFGSIALFVKVPANVNGLGPDLNYMPVLRRNSKFTSRQTGVAFFLIDDVDFGETGNQVIVTDVDSTTGNPTSYAIKSYGNVISGDIATTTIEVGDYSSYKKFDLEAPNLAEIISVTDSQGNDYFEVDYLSQDLIYTSVPNDGEDKALVPNYFKAVSVPRRFIIERNDVGSFMQFGGGANSDAIVENDKKLDPSAVALKMFAKDYVSENSFDPNILTQNNNLGIAPINTTLTVTYRTNLSDTINIGVDDIKNVSFADFRFSREETLNASQVSTVTRSLEISNEDVLVGEVQDIDSEEIRMRAMGTFATQNRAVTKQDYISLIYSLPGKFGRVKRAKITQDKDSFKRNLNLYVISEGLDGSLARTQPIVKTNLKNWLSRYKMLNDTMDIIDANILNLQIEYEAIAENGFNKFTVKDNIATVLGDYFNKVPEIGEPIYITDIYNVMNETPGVADVTDVTINVKSGGIYSSYSINLDDYISPDGRLISIPSNAIYEIRFVGDDIKGVVT